MGNKCCKSQSSAYSSANATVRSFSSYDSSAVNRSGGRHAIAYETSSRTGDSVTALAMKSTNDSDVGDDYRGGSSSAVGQDDPIPVFLRRLNDLNIRVGTRTRFLIEIDDATGVQVRWYHNNSEAENDRYQYIHEGGFYCLDIVPVTLEDEGLWVCTAQNYAGKSSTAARLSLIVPKAFKKPIFVEQLRAELTQRGIVSLECKVIGVPTPKLRWYKDDKEIKAGDIFALTANSSEDCLGVYTCEATNVMGTALSTSKIQVTRTRLDGTRNTDSLVARGPPPKFVNGLSDAAGKVGSVLYLECRVEVPPWPRSVGWYNDKGSVNDGTLYRLIADGLGTYGVEIKSLRADHGTTWKCVVTSMSGAKAVTSCSVTVSHPKNYRIPRFLESLRAVMTDEGLVSFECKVIGYPTPQLCWFKDGKQLQPGDVYELTGSKSLGSYCCVAQNCMGEASSVAELTIEDIQNQLNESEKLQLTSNTQPPRFVVGLKSTEANINETFAFMIKVITESTPSISWYKEDEQIAESNRYRFSSEENGTYVLNVVPLEIDDQAEWKCVAVNKYGQTVTSSFLKLNVPKNFKSPRFLDELRIAFSDEGSVNLECKVIGVPQPQLKWFKDGRELNPGDMHKIISGQSGTCCLGTYTCQAHNCMGTVSSSATLLTMEDKSTVKSCATDEYLSVDNPLVRNESLSTIPEERTSQMEKSYTIEEPADVSFSFDGKEVTVSLYETPDLTHDEALQIIEMYADELSEHISEDNVVDLPSLRIVKQSSISGPVMMEALVIDVPVGFCRQHTVSDTEFDGVSLSEDVTLANDDGNVCENSLEYYSDRLSSSNSKRDLFYSASETTPKNSSSTSKPLSDDDGRQPSFQTPKLVTTDSDDEVLTRLDGGIRAAQTSRDAVGRLTRSESNNTEEEVSETLAECPASPRNYCAAEIFAQSDEDGLYSTVLNRIRNGGAVTAALGTDEDNVLNAICRPNVDEFLKHVKIILDGTMVKMHAHDRLRDRADTPTELDRSIQALHSLAWKFVEETERDNVTELDKNVTDNVSCLMTAINASLLASEQADDPFGVSDNVLNEIQSSACFDLQTLNDRELPAADILDRLSGQIEHFTAVVNGQVARVTEQRVVAVLRNTIGTTLVYVRTLQQNCSKIKCVDVDSLAPLFAMVHPLEAIVNDVAVMEEAAATDENREPGDSRLKQMLIPAISSIAFHLRGLSAALKNEHPEDDRDLNDIYHRIDDSAAQFMALASRGTESNNLAECFISFTKSINDLCCCLRRLGKSTENIVSSDYGSDDKLLLDFETLFDELMMDIDTLINNVNVVRDFEDNINPLGSLLEPLQDMKIGLFQVNQVLLSNQTGTNMSYEVVCCFEHLSQQLVQLNNCIVNQSIAEETDKEIPFETSIKMMQNILFDDAIDDLGVNGILFGSVMKPLLQLQNVIVSKMASVESDLSFSEHTDVSGGVCDTQSLSLSLSNNAQTVLDKRDSLKRTNVWDETEEEMVKESGLVDGTSNVTEDRTLVDGDDAKRRDVRRGFECDVGAAFKDEEPNIITSEDDRENTGFGMLFDETDLAAAEYFLDDVVVRRNEAMSADAFTDQEHIGCADGEHDDIVPRHVSETFDKNAQQDSTTGSSMDLFDELQETLKCISEGTLSENVDGPSNTVGSDRPLDGSVGVDGTKTSVTLVAGESIEHDRLEEAVGANTEVDRNDELKSDEIEKSISDDDTLQTDRSSKDSDKTVSDYDADTNNAISEIQTEGTDEVSDVVTTVDALNSTGVRRGERVSEEDDVSDGNKSPSDYGTGNVASSGLKRQNETPDSAALGVTSELIECSDTSSDENRSQDGKSFGKQNLQYNDVTGTDDVVYSGDSVVDDAKSNADGSVIENESSDVLTSREDGQPDVVDYDDSRESRSQAEVVITAGEGDTPLAADEITDVVAAVVRPASGGSDENRDFTEIDNQSTTSNVDDNANTELNKSSSVAAMTEGEDGRMRNSAVVTDEKPNHSFATEGVANETEQGAPFSVNVGNKCVDVVAAEVVELEGDGSTLSRPHVNLITVSGEKTVEFGSNENDYDRVEIDEEVDVLHGEDDLRSAVEKMSITDGENVSGSSPVTGGNIERNTSVDNEVNAVDGLNESCQDLSKREIGNAQTTVVDDECALDGSKKMMSAAERGDDFKLSAADSKVLLVVDSDVLDEQPEENEDDLDIVGIDANNEPAVTVEESEKPDINISLNRDDLEGDVEVERGLELEISPVTGLNGENKIDEKTSGNAEQESAEVNDEYCGHVNVLNEETVGNPKRATVVENNEVTNAAVREAVENIQSDHARSVELPLLLAGENIPLVNAEVVTAESTQSMDARESEENRVEIKYEGDQPEETATYVETIVLYGKNSSDLETGEEDISGEVDSTEEDPTRVAGGRANVVGSIEPNAALTCDDVISVGSTGDADIENVELKHGKRDLQRRVSERRTPAVLESAGGHDACDDGEKTRPDPSMPADDVPDENVDTQTSRRDDEHEEVSSGSGRDGTEDDRIDGARERSPSAEENAAANSAGVASRRDLSDGRLGADHANGVEITEPNVSRSSVVGDETVATAAETDGYERSRPPTDRTDVAVYVVGEVDARLARPKENDVSETESIRGVEKSDDVEHFGPETMTGATNTEDETGESAVEETASVQDDVVPAGEIADFSVKENVEMSAAVKPRLHRVEKMAANQTECVMLENANVLTRDEHDNAENVIGRASVEHGLNIAAIGNMIIDYDSLEANDGADENDRTKRATLAAVVDETFSNEVLSKNVEVFKAPNEVLTINNGDNVIVTNNSDEECVGVTQSAEDDSVDKLSEKLNGEQAVMDALRQSPKSVDEIVEPVDTSTDNVGSLGDSAQKIEKLQTELEIEIEGKHSKNILKSFGDDQIESQQINELDAEKKKTLENIVDSTNDPAQSKESTIDEIKHDGVCEVRNDERTEDTIEKSDIKKKCSPKKKKSLNVLENISVNDYNVVTKTQGNEEKTDKFTTKLETEITENSKINPESIQNDEIESQKIDKLDADKTKSSVDTVETLNENAQIKQTEDETKNDIVCEDTKDTPIKDTKEKGDIKKKSSPKTKKSPKIAESTIGVDINVNKEKSEKIESKLQTEIIEENNDSTPKSLQNDEIESQKIEKLEVDQTKSSVDNVETLNENAQIKPNEDETKNDIVCEVTTDTPIKDTKEKGDIKKKSSPKTKKSPKSAESTIKVDNNEHEEKTKKLESKLETEILEEKNDSTPNSLQNDEIESQKNDKLEADQTKSSVDIVEILNENAQIKPNEDETKNDIVCEDTTDTPIKDTKKKGDIKKKSSPKTKKSSKIAESTIGVDININKEKSEKLESKLETKIAEENNESTPKSIQNDEFESQKLNKIDVDQTKLSVDIVETLNENAQIKPNEDETKNDIVCEDTKDTPIKDTKEKGDIKKKSSPKTKKSPKITESTIDVDINVNKEKTKKLESKLETEIIEEKNDNTPNSLQNDEIESQKIDKLEVDQTKSSVDIVETLNENAQVKPNEDEMKNDIVCEVTTDTPIKDTKEEGDIKKKSSPKTKKSPKSAESTIDVDINVNKEKTEKLESKLETEIIEEKNDNTPNSLQNDEIESQKIDKLEVDQTKSSVDIVETLNENAQVKPNEDEMKNDIVCEVTTDTPIKDTKEEGDIKKKSSPKTKKSPKSAESTIDVDINVNKEKTEKLESKLETEIIEEKNDNTPNSLQNDEIESQKIDKLEVDQTKSSVDIVETLNENAQVKPNEDEMKNNIVCEVTTDIPIKDTKEEGDIKKKSSPKTKKSPKSAEITIEVDNNKHEEKTKKLESKLETEIIEEKNDSTLNSLQNDEIESQKIDKLDADQTKSSVDIVEILNENAQIKPNEYETKNDIVCEVTTDIPIKDTKEESDIKKKSSPKTKKSPKTSESTIEVDINVNKENTEKLESKLETEIIEEENDSTPKLLQNDEIESQKIDKLDADQTKSSVDTVETLNENAQIKQTEDETKNDIVCEVTTDIPIKDMKEESDIKKKSSPKTKKSPKTSESTIEVDINVNKENTEKLESKLETKIAEENNESTTNSIQNDEIESQKIDKLEADQTKSSVDIVEILNENAQIKPNEDETKNDIVCEVTTDIPIKDTKEEGDIKKKSSPKTKKSPKTTENTIEVDINVNKENTEKLESKLETKIAEEKNDSTPKSLQNDEIESQKIDKLDADQTKSSVDTVETLNENAQIKQTEDETKNDIVCEVTTDIPIKDTKEEGDIKKKSSPKTKKSPKTTENTIEVDINVNKENTEKLESKLETKIAEEKNDSTPKSLQNDEIESQKIDKLDADQTKSSVDTVETLNENAQIKQTEDETKNDIVCEVTTDTLIKDTKEKGDIKKKSSPKTKKSPKTAERIIEIDNNEHEEKNKKLESKLEMAILEEKNDGTPMSLQNQIESQKVDKLDVDQMKTSVDEIGKEKKKRGSKKKKNTSEERPSPDKSMKADDHAIDIRSEENVNVTEDHERVETTTIAKAKDDERMEKWNKTVAVDKNGEAERATKRSPEGNPDVVTTETDVASGREIEACLSRAVAARVERNNDTGIRREFPSVETALEKSTGRIGEGRERYLDTASKYGKSLTPEPSRGRYLDAAPTYRKSPTPEPSRGRYLDTASKYGKSLTPEPSRGLYLDTVPTYNKTLTPEPSRGRYLDAAPTYCKSPTPEPSRGRYLDTASKYGKSLTPEPSHGRYLNTVPTYNKSLTPEPSREHYFDTLSTYCKSLTPEPSRGRYLDTVPTYYKSLTPEPSRGHYFDTLSMYGKSLTPEPSRGRYLDAASTYCKSLTPEPSRGRYLDTALKYGKSLTPEPSRGRYLDAASTYCKSLTPEPSRGRYLDTVPTYCKSLTPEPSRGRYTTRTGHSRSADVVDGYLFDPSRLFARYATPAGRFYSSQTASRPPSYIRHRRPDDSDIMRSGSDGFLYDSCARYSSCWPPSAEADLHRTKETFRRLYFCVRLTDRTVRSGVRVGFRCSVVGHPEPRVQWYRDGRELRDGIAHARYATSYADGVAQLIVEDARDSDSGGYTCVAANGRDRASTTGFLTVYTSAASGWRPAAAAPAVDDDDAGDDDDDDDDGGRRADRRPARPTFAAGITADDAATRGRTFALQVRVRGSPWPTVTWTLGSRPLPSRSSAKHVCVDDGRGLYTLLVRDATARDGGTYACRACNLYGSADAQKTVRVVWPHDGDGDGDGGRGRRGTKPAIIVSRPDDRLNVAVGEDIAVALRVAGQPKPKVIWMRGATDVTFMDRSLKETVNDYVMLSIKKARLSDAGTYFIVAKNVYGSDRAFVTVRVSDRVRVSPDTRTTSKRPTK